MIKYEKKIEDLYNELNDLFDRQSEDVITAYDLNKKMLSLSIIYRLRTYYLHQDKIKSSINKNLAASASDYFVETVAFYLKNVLKRYRPDLTVHSERTIKFNGKNLRPDISIFKGTELHSIIECKTQLGWNRGNWKADFINREKNIHESYPNTNVYLAVMTSRNWSGLENDEYENKKFFVLSSLWPSEISNDDDLEKSIINPFEILFKSIVDKS